MYCRNSVTLATFSGADGDLCSRKSGSTASALFIVADMRQFFRIAALTEHESADTGTGASGNVSLVERLTQPNQANQHHT